MSIIRKIKKVIRTILPGEVYRGAKKWWRDLSLPQYRDVVIAVLHFFHVSFFYLVKIEGGTSSQMEQYVLGQRIKELGFPVKYDLSFYKNGEGKDCLGIHARDFNITQIDRNLVIEKASAITIKFYKIFFSYDRNPRYTDALNGANIPNVPMYLDGYGYQLYWEREFEDCFTKSIRVNFDETRFGEQNNALYREISSRDNCVGIHVRRGDTLLPRVGRPIAKKEYYLKALSYFPKDIPVYIFSDDLEWVKNDLIPAIPNADVTPVEGNDSKDGWKDLILLSTCKHQIKSPAGGMGRDAFRLNRYPDKMLIRPVYVEGNHMNLSGGKIIDIVLDDELCDLSNVQDRTGVL